MPACPFCHSRGLHRRIARSEYPSTTPVLIGGPLLAIAVDLIKRRALRCAACGQTFRERTFAYGLLLGTFLLLIGLPLLVWLVQLVLFAL